jgi:uncharacterized protein YbjQ (UPF0145 family)
MTAPVEPFICDLSVAELLLISGAGWVPITLVGGDCSYDPGHQYTSRTYSKNLHWISEGLSRGQTLALERMREQAAEVGSDGVIGVRLIATDIEISTDKGVQPTCHFSAVGTAVRRHDTPPRDAHRPFTSHLSGQDTWALTVAGCQPLGVVFGFSTYHVKTTWQRPGRPGEMSDLTNGMYGAREIAMHHMQTQATGLQADGVVGVSIDLKITPGPTIVFTALGTAIRTSDPHISHAPQMVMELKD